MSEKLLKYSLWRNKWNYFMPWTQAMSDRKGKEEKTSTPPGQ